MSIENLEQFAGQFKVLLDQKPAWPQLLEKGRTMLSELVSKPEWFQATLSNLILDKAFLKSQWQSIDPNDIQIYYSSDKSFSIRAFVWEPDVFYPVHDHGAWGIVGAHINSVREKKFTRIDDGLDPHHAELKVTADAVLAPGGTTFVLPVNEGIHQMEAVNNQVAVSIHVYGTPVRKGYIHYFNRHNNTAERMYPPSIYKKMLAIRTLGSIPEPWAKDVLTTALNTPDPDYILQECQFSLDRINS